MNEFSSDKENTTGMTTAGYIYNISHDVGAPLRAILGFSRLLQKLHAGSLNEEGKEFLALIVESGEKMQKMLASLLELSRIGGHEIHPVDLDMGRIIADCVASRQSRMEDAKAAISIPDLPPIRGDGALIAKLVGIIFDNALLYREWQRKLKITLTAKTENNRVYFQIEDNGQGISPKYRDRLFVPFKRPHSEEEFPGLGMGLAFAKAIVERHGGSIGVESTHGAGTKVSFDLPQGEGK